MQLIDIRPLVDKLNQLNDTLELLISKIDTNTQLQREILENLKRKA